LEKAKKCDFVNIENNEKVDANSKYWPKDPMQRKKKYLTTFYELMLKNCKFIIKREYNKLVKCYNDLETLDYKVQSEIAELEFIIPDLEENANDKEDKPLIRWINEEIYC